MKKLSIQKCLVSTQYCKLLGRISHTLAVIRRNSSPGPVTITQAFTRQEPGNHTSQRPFICKRIVRLDDINCRRGWLSSSRNTQGPNFPPPPPPVQLLRIPGSSLLAHWCQLCFYSVRVVPYGSLCVRHIQTSLPRLDERRRRIVGCKQRGVRLFERFLWKGRRAMLCVTFDGAWDETRNFNFLPVWRQRVGDYMGVPRWNDNVFVFWYPGRPLFALRCDWCSLINLFWLFTRSSRVIFFFFFRPM